MRDRDRFWWVALVIGLVFVVAGVLAPYYLLTTVPWGDPSLTSAEYTQDIGLAALIVVMGLGFGIGFALSGVPMRRRHRVRLAALRGDVAAMPLAAIHPNPASAPDVADQPLELMWRSGKGTRYLQGPLIGVELLTALISVGASMFVLIGPVFLPALFVPSDPYSPPPQPMSLVELVWRLVAACVVLALVVAGGIWIARVLPFLFGRPFGITATATGLEKRTEFGNRVRVAWEDMRLLEVTKGGTAARRGLVVYAPGKSISWMEYTGSFGTGYAPVGATSSEMTLRQAALLDLIAARTGLTPRTFDKSLEPAPARAAKRAAKRAASVIVLLVVALLVAGLAAAEWFFPLTPFLWVNWASSASLGVLAVLLLSAGAWSALPRRELPAHAAPPSAGAPSLDAPGVTYEFTWRTPLLRRLWFVLSGLILSVNLAPGLYMLLEVLSVMLALLVPSALSPLPFNIFPGIGHYLLALVLAVTGLFGLALAYGGAVAATTQIRANKDGLASGRGRRERLIPWSSVQGISWGLGAGKQTAYVVKSDVPTLRISWPAGPQPASGPPPRDGALPIGADELAALVAARTEKPIGIRK